VKTIDFPTILNLMAAEVIAMTFRAERLAFRVLYIFQYLGLIFTPQTPCWALLSWTNGWSLGETRCSALYAAEF
jgi:hypothetical protein